MAARVFGPHIPSTLSVATGPAAPRGMAFSICWTIMVSSLRALEGAPTVVLIGAVVMTSPQSAQFAQNLVDSNAIVAPSKNLLKQIYRPNNSVLPYSLLIRQAVPAHRLQDQR